MFGVMPKTASSTVIWRSCLPWAFRTASFILARPPVPGTAHPEQHVLVAGDGALHHQDVARRIRLDHSEVLHGHLAGPHVAGHLHPLDDATRVRAGADGAGGAGAVGLPVGLGPAVEAVSLHHAREAATLGGPRSEERRVGKEGRSRWSPYH